MKLSIAKEQLIAGLQTVQNAVGTRSTLPVLSNVLLVAGDGELALTGTDLDITVSCSVEATVEEGGSTTLPVKRFLGIVKELPTPEIEIEISENNVCSIQSGSSFYKIHGVAAEDFPKVGSFDDDAKLTLPQEKLKAMLKRTSFAISTDETRYVLNGIYLKSEEDKLTMVATDGRRLAMVEEETGGELTGEFIIPTKAVNELNRLLGTDGEIELKFKENQASFNLSSESGTDALIITKLVEGNYPNYRQVIPNTENAERVELVREEVYQALRRAELMTNDKSNSVKLAFTENLLTITANTPDVGEGREKIAINYGGREISIAFNPIYFMDPLKALEEDEFTMELIDELSPGLIKTKSPFLYVLMPMRMS